MTPNLFLLVTFIFVIGLTQYTKVEGARAVMKVDFKCDPEETSTHPHPKSCTKFISCVRGKAFERSCGSCEPNQAKCPNGKLFYNDKSQTCGPANEIKCNRDEGDQPNKPTPKPQNEATPTRKGLLGAIGAGLSAGLGGGKVTTKEPKGAPTTKVPVGVTTQVPTTKAPAAAVPTTSAPTTKAPVTEAKTTKAPAAVTTKAPVTEAKTTKAPEVVSVTTPAGVITKGEVISTTEASADASVSIEVEEVEEERRK